jgi:hypothetical protein
MNKPGGQFHLNTPTELSSRIHERRLPRLVLLRRLSQLCPLPQRIQGQVRQRSIHQSACAMAVVLHKSSISHITQPNRSRGLSSHISSAAHAEALVMLEVDKDWFSDGFMTTSEQITLVIIPIEEMAPRYRDEMPTAHFNPVGVPNLFLSPILEAPGLTVPSRLFSIPSEFLHSANATSW